MAEQSKPSFHPTKAGPFSLVGFVSGTNRSVWECATCQSAISISCRKLEHVDRCTALMDNGRPCESMYSTKYGCSKHPYFEGHNAHMRKHCCQRPIISYSLRSLSNLMPKSKTSSLRRPSSPVGATSSGLRYVQSFGPQVPPPPPSSPQPGQPKLEFSSGVRLLGPQVPPPPPSSPQPGQPKLGLELVTKDVKKPEMVSQTKSDKASDSSHSSRQTAAHSTPRLVRVGPKMTINLPVMMHLV